VKKSIVRKFSPTSVSYDARIFSFKQFDYSVSLKLLFNRVRFDLDTGNYQRGILKGQKPKSATLVKRRSGEYYIHINLEPAWLRVMSSEWLIQLEQAAEELDEDLLIELLEQIPDEHTRLADALKNKVDDFNFDAIIDLVQQAVMA
jgi:hypothetical protein